MASIVINESELMNTHFAKIFYSEQIVTDLEAVNLLRALEYTGLKDDQVFGLVSTTFDFSPLIEEFEFKHITALPHSPSVQCTTIDSIFFKTISTSNFLEKLRQEIMPFSEETSNNLKIDPNKCYTFKRHSRLGDALSIVLGFENFALNNNIDAIQLSGVPVFKDIIRIFKCERVFYQEFHHSPINLDFVFSLASWNTPWMLRFNHALCDIFGGIPSLNITAPGLPSLLAQKKFSDTIFCQFDSRSSGNSCITDAPKILQTFCHPDSTIKVLGGPDTTPYLGTLFEYRLGNLDFILEQLLQAKYFLGADSGIGHLAGLLEVPSYIFNSTDYDPVYHFFKNYKNTVVVNRKILDLPKISA